MTVAVAMAQRRGGCLNAWQHAPTLPHYPFCTKLTALFTSSLVQELKVFDHLASAFNLNREDVTWEQVRAIGRMVLSCT